MAFFTDLTRKIGVFGCKFYSHKNCVSVKKNDNYKVCLKQSESGESSASSESVLSIVSSAISASSASSVNSVNCVNSVSSLVGDATSISEGFFCE